EVWTRQLDTAEQRRRDRESGKLGQKAANLDLGIDAVVQLSIDLDDIVVVNERGGIGLFCLHWSDRLDRYGRRRIQPRGRFELELDPGLFDHHTVAQILQNGCDEFLISRDVDQCAFARS